MAEVLCVYRDVEVRRAAVAAGQDGGDEIAIVSYDEKPGYEGVSGSLCKRSRISSF